MFLRPLLVAGLTALGSFFVASPAFALSLETVFISGVTTAPLGVIVGRIFGILLTLLGIIAFIIIIYGGIVWMTSGGNAQRIEQAKKIMISGAIGLLIILAALAITAFLMNGIQCILTGQNCPGGGPPPGTCTIGTESGCNDCVDDGLGNGVWVFDPSNPGCSLGGGSSLSVLWVSPQDGATNVPICRLVQARFNANLNCATVSASTVHTRLNCSVGGDALCAAAGLGTCGGTYCTNDVSGTFACAADIFTFDPTNEFEKNGAYHVTIDGGASGVKSASGLSCTGFSCKDWDFTTGTESDKVPPIVSLVSPKDAASDVCLLKPVSTLFSEEMDALSLIAAGAFSITPTSTQDGLNDLSFSASVPAPDALREYPRKAYAENTAFTPLLHADVIQDACGNNLDGNTNGTAEGSPTDDYAPPPVGTPPDWSFTTGTTPQCAPEITSLAPGSSYYDNLPPPSPAEDTVVLAGTNFDIIPDTVLFSSNVSTTTGSQGCFNASFDATPNACFAAAQWTDSAITTKTPAGNGSSNGAITGPVQVQVGQFFCTGARTCKGGANVGLACSSNAECPGSACGLGSCDGGSNAGNGCDLNTECPGATSGPQTLTVLSPHTNGISPSTGGPGTWVTVSGSKFQSTPGKVRLRNPSSGTWVDANLPCTSSWRDTYIIVEIPTDFPTAGNVRIQVYTAGADNIFPSADDRHSNINTDFTLNGNAPGPGICSLSESCGEAGISSIDISGKRFGASGLPSQITFNSKTVKPASSIGSWTDTKITNVGVPVGLPDDTYQVKVTVGGIDSNTLPYSIPCPTIFCDADTTSPSCQPDNAVCAAALGPSALCDPGSCTCVNDAVRVVEDASCSLTSQSPSPYRDSTNACTNAVLSARFTANMDDATLLAKSNYRLENCATDSSCVAPTPVDISGAEWTLSSFVWDVAKGREGVTLAHAPDLAPSTYYRITLRSAGLRSELGTALDGDRDGTPGGDYAWTFRTATGPCSLAQVSCIPRTASTGVGGIAPFSALAAAANCNLVDRCAFDWTWTESSSGTVATLGVPYGDAACPAGSFLADATGVAAGNTNIVVSTKGVTTPYAWISGSSTDSVFRVDTDTGAITGPFAVGDNPSRTAVDLLGNAWVANRDSGNVTKLDPNGSTLKTCATGSGPRGVAVDADGNVWVANANDDNVVQISGDDTSCAILKTVAVGDYPYGLAIDGGGNVWSLNRSSANVTKIRVSDGAVLGTFPTGLAGSYGIAIDQSNDVWISHWEGQGVTKLAGSSGALLLTVPLGKNARAIAIDGFGNAWTTHSLDDQVTKIANNGTVLGTFSVDDTAGNDHPIGVAVTADQSVWVVNYNSAKIHRLSGNGTTTAVYDLPPGTQPYTYSDFAGFQLRFITTKTSFTSPACVLTVNPQTGICGNGVREGSEECDGSDLGGQSCTTKGYSGGTLACSPSCKFDISGCTGGGPGTSCDADPSTPACEIAPVCGAGLGCAAKAACSCRDIPSVTSVVWAKDPSGLACKNTAITVRFSTIMDASSFTVDTGGGGTVSLVQGATYIGGSLAFTNLDTNADGKPDAAEMIFTPVSLLANNSSYTFTVKGGPTGVLSQYGLTMGADSVTVLTTGSEICKLDHVDITVTKLVNGVPTTLAPPDFYTCAGKDTCPDDINAGLSGNQHRFTALAKDASGAALAATYAWTENDPSSIITIESPGTQTSDITAAPKNGQALAIVEADGGVAGKVKGSAGVTVALCENPWPSLASFPYTDTATRFQTWYCKDTTPPLPDLTVVTRAGSGILKKEFLFYDAANSRDAVGIRVYDNPQALSPELWASLFAPNVKGTPAATTVNGWPATRIGRTTYVGAAIQNSTSGLPFNTYLFLISYAEGASPVLINIANQMVKNWVIAYNISDLNTAPQGQPSNSPLAKLKRDVFRLSDLFDIADDAINKKNQTGAFVRLAAGTYLQGHSTSRWPSWQQTLTPEVGGTLPVDPINSFYVGASCSQALDYEEATCWNEPAKKFFCDPNGGNYDSHVYHYKYVDDAKAFLYAALEYDAGGGNTFRNASFADPCSGTSSSCACYNYTIDLATFKIITIPAHCTNGVQDGGETGIDCGGPDCGPCAISGTCGNLALESGEECEGPSPVCPSKLDPSCYLGVSKAGVPYYCYSNAGTPSLDAITTFQPDDDKFATLGDGTYLCGQPANPNACQRLCPAGSLDQLPSCGNGIWEPWNGEQCDGTQGLGNYYCNSGSPSCNATCQVTCPSGSPQTCIAPFVTSPDPCGWAQFPSAPYSYLGFTTTDLFGYCVR